LPCGQMPYQFIDRIYFSVKLYPALAGSKLLDRRSAPA
jgi:hypothetical protein